MPKNPPQKRNIPAELRKKGSAARQMLTRAVRYARKADAGKHWLPYKNDRAFSQAPFYEGLRDSIQRRITRGKGKIRVLDKGAGIGNIAAAVKRMAPEKIVTTAISVSNSYTAENRPLIDKTIRGIGLTSKHGGKYHIIYDCHGEDYHLPKELVKHSIENSIARLVRGGELFTVIPYIFRRSIQVFDKAEALAMVQELSQRPDITVETKTIPKRHDKREYADLVIHVTRKR